MESEKIVLPENLQREMMKFFAKAAAQNDSERQQALKRTGGVAND